MLIKQLRIENFRGFQNQQITLNPYSCFVGPNGAGKSTVLAALNVFFREQGTSVTDTSKLSDEDFYNKDISKPIRITITFTNLTPAAKEDLKEYVRHGELVVTAVAEFDHQQQIAPVRHFGQRSGMDAFRSFFEAAKAGKSAQELGAIYSSLRNDFPDLPNPKSKEDRAEALRAYESGHSAECVQIPSEDNFYGINSTGKLAKFVQWVYVPAVKDAGQEGVESKNTAFGKLVARAVRARTNFDADLEKLKKETFSKYDELLKANATHLDELSSSLETRLQTWAHPNVKVSMEWISDPSKSVVVQQPVAGLKTGDGDFLGNLVRMGHGLQRSYLLALLQELATSNTEDAPTLILGCEEPELYQHPPQARHLSDVLTQLSEGNSQVLLTTHSPYFVTGEGFENVRLIRASRANAGATVSSATHEQICQRLRSAYGEALPKRLDGLVAKIHQAVQPNIAEMFFAQIPILVEGLEDVSYITTVLHLTKRWPEFRRLGCHLVPVNRKSNLLHPLAIAKELGLSVFTIFDADGDKTKSSERTKHEKDNKAILSLLGLNTDPFPDAVVFGNKHVIWPSNLGDAVRADFGEDHARYLDEVRKRYAHEGDIEKYDLFIAEWLSDAYKDGNRSATLESLCETILAYARNASRE